MQIPASRRRAQLDLAEAASKAQVGLAQRGLRIDLEPTRQIDHPRQQIAHFAALFVKRLGSVYQPELHKHLPILVFDHHITNTYYGTANVIIGELASAAEIILQLIQRMKIALTHDIATSLLTGLVSDTQAFRTTSTTADSMAAAMILMKAKFTESDLPICTNGF